MNKPLFNIILHSVVYCVSFSKEYTANTQEELIRKLQQAKGRTIDHLASLDIVPKQVDISQDNQIYQLPNGKFAVKIHFFLEYYPLKNQTCEEKSKIHDEICSEQHNMKHFKYNRKEIPHPQCLKSKRYRNVRKRTNT